jgi:hypothetical protein
MTKQKPTREDIIKAWKEVDAKSDRPVGQKQVAGAMGISPFWITKLFAGKSLTDMKIKHGIRLSPQEKHLTDDEMFSQLDKVLLKHKRIPGWMLLNEETGIPEGTWKKKLGGRRGCSQQDVYRKYHDWLQVKNPKSKNLEVVTAFLEKPHLLEMSPPADDSPAARGKRTPSYQKKEGEVVGPLLRFRNLTYEPTNEQGVVFLFGMVSEELGFSSIERLGTDFPDCTAYRKVSNQRELQRVRIEFEFKSSSYQGHDPNGCDVIICWEHNWRECPSSLEVIALKKEIKGLRDR